MRQLLTTLRKILPKGTPMSTATIQQKNSASKSVRVNDVSASKPLIHSDIFFPETVEAHDPNPPASIKQKSIDISHDEIAVRAYYIWQNTGNEDAFGNWMQAFQQLVEENLAVADPALLAYKE